MSVAASEIGYPEDEVAYLERERIFNRSWAYATAADRIAAPGGYVAVPVGDASVLLVRDGVGVLRAFKNVCQHRGHELASGAGSCRTLQCPYHSWTYNLQGGLIAAPYMQGKLDFSTIKLTPAAIQIVGGLLFVNLNGDAEEVDGTVTAAASACEGLALSDTSGQEVGADWKFVTELLLERLGDGKLTGDYVWPNQWWLRDDAEKAVVVARVFPDGPCHSQVLLDRYAIEGRATPAPEFLSDDDLCALEQRQQLGVSPETSGAQVRKFRAGVRAAAGEPESVGAR